MKRYCLVFAMRSFQKTIYPLLETTTIGRGSDNSITAAHPTISRNHARVSFLEGSWVAEDLGSTNGIMFGDDRVEHLVLRPGDKFKIGEITFQFIAQEVGQEKDQALDTLEILSAVIEEEDIPPGRAKGKPWAQRLRDAIAAIPFFSGVAETERKRLADTAAIHVLNDGEIIIREGDPGRSIFIVLDGQVRIYTRDFHGKELELAVLGEGQFFGEMSFLSGKPRSSSVAAIDNCLLIELSFTNMREVVRQHPSVKNILLEYYNDRLKDSQEKRAKVGMVERRRHPRLKDGLEVNLVGFTQTTAEGESSLGSLKATSQNISESGINLVVQGPVLDAIDHDDQMSLEIELPEPWGKIRTLGAIRRIQPHPDEREVTVVALEFVNLSAEDSQKLIEYIYGEDHSGP
ncbi:MAG: cyclic nucleotide-binding domain-containing protein [Syntrophobacterales bacterium]